MNKSIITKIVKITETRLYLSRAEIEQSILEKLGLSNGNFTWRGKICDCVIGCTIDAQCDKEPIFIYQHSYEYDTEKKLLQVKILDVAVIEKMILTHHHMENGDVCWHDYSSGLHGCTIILSKSTVLDNQTINQSSL